MRWIFVLVLFLAAAAAAAEEPQPPFFTPRDCGAGTALPEGIAAECGTVTVLENRDRPDGPRINLAVATLWRKDQDLAPDPLLFIQGGPGLMTHLEPEGLQAWASVLKAQEWLGERRLILFDQRGVGASPVLPVPCATFDTYAADRVIDHRQPPDDAWLASFRRNAKACWARFREAGHDPSQLTTAAIAADVADLRRALNYATWNLWGVSFGSRIAFAVMRDHPQGIRSIIADGVLPPEANAFDSVANIGAAFDTLVRACRTDPYCNRVYPNFEQRFFTLAAQYDRRPRQIVVHLPRSQTIVARIDGWTFRNLAYEMLENRNVALVLPRLVAETEAANATLLAAAMTGHIRASETGQSRAADDVYASVVCTDLMRADEGGIGPVESEDARFADQVLDAAMDGYCASWPVARSSASDAAPVTSAIPALLVSGGFDPITPPAWAEAAVKRLANGYSYVFPAWGHNVLVNDQPCALRIAGHFLDDPSKRPDDDCFARLGPMIFP